MYEMIFVLWVLGSTPAPVGFHETEQQCTSAKKKVNTALKIYECIPSNKKLFKELFLEVN